MRRFFILLTFVLIACLTQTSQARKLALLIGVNEYESISSLQFCVNDMNTFKNSLMKIGFEEDDISMLLTGDAYRSFPTKTNIEKKLSNIISSAEPSDMVFIAFSGQGFQNGKEAYICPPDVELDKLEETSIAVNKMVDDLAKCKAKIKWVIIDACRNQVGSYNEKESKENYTPPEGIVLFQSCSKGEMSYDDTSNNGSFGYFSKNLAAAISGDADFNFDGRLTLLEVCAWTSSQTQYEVMQAYKKTQRPSLSGSISDISLAENVNISKGKVFVDEAQLAMDLGNYSRAVEKLDQAIALYPHSKYWNREHALAVKMMELKNQASSGEENSLTSSPVESSSGSNKAGDRKVVKINGVEFAFRWCPAGTFIMGSPESEEGRGKSEIQHQVTLTKGFWMMETEVTQKQWKMVMGENPSYFKGDDNPVESISWDDCREFCKRAAALGLPLQLPTEAQWEYACRAGTTGAYAGNMDEIGWYSSNCKQSQPVAKKKPNPWGLYDMHGNIEEWCLDLRTDYPIESVTDPVNLTEGEKRTMRGGCWLYTPDFCRSASRSSWSPFNHFDTMGVRFVKGE